VTAAPALAGSIGISAAWRSGWFERKMEKATLACALAARPTFWRRPISLRAVKAVVCVTVLFSASRPIWAQQKPDDLTTISIEDLMNIKVTSASKKEQTLSRVAAAMFVITQKDIQQSGSTNIPDLLRMVPGLDVAQIDSNTWAISARGFNEEFSDKLMVMSTGAASIRRPLAESSGMFSIFPWKTSSRSK
jgi:outer membrane receptor protein involved in Fe transport